MGGHDAKMTRETTQDLLAKIDKLTHENEELNKIFEMQDARIQEATALWQRECGQPETWPDIGSLLQWLMERVHPVSWSDATPTVGGWYWLKQANVQSAVVFVYLWEGELWVDRFGYVRRLADIKHAKWAGPIQEPGP